MMKKVLMMLLFIILFSAPVAATAGEAYIPYFRSSQLAPAMYEGSFYSSDKGYYYSTHIYVTNISKKAQHVTVKLFKKDGTPLRDYVVNVITGLTSKSQFDTASMTWIAGIPETTPLTTDDDGAVSFELGARSQATFVIQPSENDTDYSGFGIISNKNKREDHDRSDNSLVAFAEIIGAITDEDYTLYTQSLPITSVGMVTTHVPVQINGGSPF